MNLKQTMVMVVATVLAVVTSWGQVEVISEPGSGELGEARTLDQEAQAIIKQAPDDEAKLTAIRALVATNSAQSNWLAEAEAKVLTKLGEEEQAVEAAKRISEPES